MTTGVNIPIDANGQGAVSEINKVDAALERMGNDAAKNAATVNQALSTIKSPSLAGKLGGNLVPELNNTATSAQRLGGVFKGLGADAATSMSSMAPGGQILQGLASGGFVAAAGVLAVGAAMVAGALAASAWADELADTAANLGVTTAQLQIMNGVAALNGGSSEAMQKGFAKLNQTVGEASLGNKQAIADFAQLGVAIKDAEGNIRPTSEIFAETRDRLSEIQDPAQRAAVGAGLLGKAYKENAAYFSQSSAELAKQTAFIEQYAVASDSAIAAAGGLQDELGLMGQVVQAGVIEAFAPLAEMLGELAHAAIPYVSAAFKGLGEILDLVISVGKLVWDALSALWDVISGLVSPIIDVISNMVPMIAIFKSTGNAAGTLRQRFFNALADMAAFTGRVVGAIAAKFAFLRASMQNLIADLNNAVLDSGLGRLVGVSERMAKVDPNKESAAARGRVEKGFGGLEKNLRGRGKDDTKEETAATAENTRVLDANTDAQKKNSAAKSGKDTAAEATKKYNDAIKALEDDLKDVTRSEQELAIVTNFAKAGLERSLAPLTSSNKLIADRAKKVKELTLALMAANREEAVHNKLASDSVERQLSAMESLDEDLGTNDAARIRARMAARKATPGLVPADMDDEELFNSVATDILPNRERVNRTPEEEKVDESADATVRLAEQKKATEEYHKMLEEFSKADSARDFEEQKRDAEKLVGMAKEQELARIGYAAENEAINQRLRKRLEEIEAMKLEADARQELVDLANRQAEADRKQAKGDERAKLVDAAQAKAEKLYDTMMQLWEDPKEFMRQFFADLLKKIAIAILRAIILKAILGPAAGADGNIGSSIMSSLGFGGGKAVGGSVDSNKYYLVGERGPELFAPGRAGTIIPNHNIGGSSGGGGFNYAPTINFHASGNAETDQRSFAQLKMEMARQRMEIKNTQRGRK